ncbi:dihydrofolate reductase family protein [Cellulomonas endometrii]|uniref:dihydrofolate reductase family protein n=1 Tax=Cellulomonas endometrii TaxID=3036301 RepID=UPI0024AD3E81|nr:dihydrofolate reductase family protein [Cellulomonas endometrii]
MATLVYSAITSLDSFVADRSGRFDWSVPDEEVHQAVNDLHRGVGTYLYGRRLYDVMVAWETMPTADQSPAVQDFAQLWRAAHKVVYSTTLAEPRSTRTQVEPTFDPEAVRRLLASSPHDVLVGGAHLSAHAFRAGLVGEVHLFVSPVLVGGGTRALPRGVRLDLELLGVRRFGNGVAHLHHRVRPGAPEPVSAEPVSAGPGTTGG